MTVQFFCDVSHDSKKVIEQLVQVWAKNNPNIMDEDWIFEVRKILSRGFTRAITYLGRFGRPGKEGVSRVFKIDYLVNVKKEAIAALTLDNTITAKFFCRIKNNPNSDQWTDDSGDQLGIIEYEYAGDMGTTDSVDTLLAYIFKQYQKTDKDHLSKLTQNISYLFDDVIQGLKTKVYNRNKQVNVSGKDIYGAKIKHFTEDYLLRLLTDIPPHIKRLFPETPNTIYSILETAINRQLDTYYSSEIIHGDLNPTNILVYSGYDRSYATLIDFLEMEVKKEEKFTPYFWDFARLEGELVLSFFTKGFIPPDQFEIAVPALLDSLYEMTPIPPQKSELHFISLLFIELRKSFFRTKNLHLDISFDSPDVIKSFYYNLLIFYVFMSKYENSSLEQFICIAIAKKIAIQIPDIDSKWVLEKIKEPKAEKPVKKNNTKIVIALGTVILAILIALGYFHFIKPDLKTPFANDQFDKANQLVKNELYEEALPIYEDLLKKTFKKDHPDHYARIKHSEGICYYQRALYIKKEVNLKKAILSFEEALKIVNANNNSLLYSDIQKDLGLAYSEISMVRDKENSLKKALESFNKAIKIRTKEKHPKVNATLTGYLGKVYIRLSQVRDKKKNLNTAIDFLNRALLVLTKEKYPKDYAWIQHYLGNSFSALSETDLAYSLENLLKAIDYYENSLKIRTIEKFSAEHALTQNSLGTVYLKIAIIKDKATDKEQNLDKAIDLYNKALKIKTSKTNPVDHAMTQLNLGVAYRVLSNIRDQKKNLLKAIKVNKNLTQIFTVVDYPLYYGKAYLNIGAIFYSLAVSEEDDRSSLEYFNKSISAFKEAKQIFKVEKYPVLYGEVEKNLGNVYAGLAKQTNADDKESIFSKAIEAIERSLVVYTKEKYPKKYADLCDNIGDFYREKAMLTEDNELDIEKSKEAYNKALEVWTEDKFPDIYMEIKKKLDSF